MIRAYVGLGSNLGRREEHLLRARDGLAALAGAWLVAFSRVYETAPVGPVPQGAFLNAAAALDTDLAPADLLAALQTIEAGEGRVPRDRRVRWGPRELDLDILLYGDQVLPSEPLRVPHPHMTEREFVLRPLADIAPWAVHPLTGRSVAELLAALPGSHGR